jgi:hypothetical protein
MKKDKLKFLFSKWYYNYYDLEEIKELYNEYYYKISKELNMILNDLNKIILNKDELKDVNQKTESVPCNDEKNDNVLDKNENKFIKKIIKKLN